MNQSHLLLVGFGKMGSALYESWNKAQIFSRITIVDPAAGGIALPSPDGIDPPDVVVFAVKPQMIDQIMADYIPHITQETLVISILAGKTIGFFENHLHLDQPIIRTMPNTPSAIGCGITACLGNAHTTQSHRAICQTMFEAAGDVVWLQDEDQFHLVTALSGSGPAYQFLFAEYLTQAATELGLPEDLSLQLAKTTLWGSAELMHRSDLPLSTLRENVTSPKGTTEAALNVLMQQPFYTELKKALQAASNRSQELS